MIVCPSGHVDSEELRRVLVECGRMKLTEEEADEFIGGFTNHHGGGGHDKQDDVHDHH